MVTVAGELGRLGAAGSLRVGRALGFVRQRRSSGALDSPIATRRPNLKSGHWPGSRGQKKPEPRADSELTSRFWAQFAGWKRQGMLVMVRVARS